MTTIRMLTCFISGDLFYSDSADYADIGEFSSEFRFLGLLLLIFFVGCVLAGFLMLRRQWRRMRLQNPRKDYYRRRR